jgi:hypothetical protein
MSEERRMETLLSIRDGRVITLMPMQALFGAGEIDAEIIIEVELAASMTEDLEESLHARCASL